MNELISHIEFLLHRYPCVIVPGLGGFVINIAPVSRNGLNIFEPPKVELVFNQNLSYNDGLLAESFMRKYQISFERAMLKIEEGVKEIRYQFEEFGSIHLGNLGVMSINEDDRFNFTPKNFEYPAYFGLERSQLKPIIHVQSMQPDRVTSGKSDKAFVRNLTIGATVAAAAIAILLFLNPFQSDFSLLDKAQIGSIPQKEVVIAQPKPAPANTNVAVAESNKTEIQETGIAPTVTTATTSVEAPAEIVAPNEVPRYYVIVGVYEVRKVANEILADLQKQGLSTASTLKKYNRINVFAASFDKEGEAYEFLRTFRNEKPKYKDAWVLKY